MTDQEICGACDGSRRMPKDPDIGTDQECFVCDGSGVISAHEAKAAPASTQDEPFGYFRAEPFGWTDCAATDEGAIALYERPAAPAVPQGEPVMWVMRAHETGQLNPARPHQKAKHPKIWSDAFPLYAATPAAPSQETAVPEGWKLVPVEPTPEMGRAYLEAAKIHAAEGAEDKMRFSPGGYAAMLSATPAAPSQPVTDEYVASHLEAAGVKFQRFKGGISGTKDCWSTSGSQDVRKLANGVRAIIAALREKGGV